jgi:hypothetical protein
MVAEHTWGVDIKTYLRDETAWDRADFAARRGDDYRFAYTEQSWAEQRAYLDTAVATLAPADRAEADAALAGLAVPPAPETQPGLQLADNGWGAELDAASGDIIRLVAPDGGVIAGRDDALFGYRHESYDWAELQTHLDSYLQHRESWAVLDHDKPGLATSRTARTASFAPGPLVISPDGRRGIGLLPAEASELLGGPGRIELALRGIDRLQVEITLTLRDKPANRLPEAGFFNFTPDGCENWEWRRLGLWNGSKNIVRRGGGQLQAIEAARSGSLTIAPLDCALVAPAGTPFLPFQPEIPDYSAGLRFNLYNNKWGTNFPMWWEGEIAFRFLLTLDG